VVGLLVDGGLATAAVITAQQDRIRERFAHVPTGELKLLPTSRRNQTETKRSDRRKGRELPAGNQA